LSCVRPDEGINFRISLLRSRLRTIIGKHTGDRPRVRNPGENAFVPDSGDFVWLTFDPRAGGPAPDLGIESENIQRQVRLGVSMSRHQLGQGIPIRSSHTCRRWNNRSHFGRSLEKCRLESAPRRTVGTLHRGSNGRSASKIGAATRVLNAGDPLPRVPRSLIPYS
jgi:hypothetical protein